MQSSPISHFCRCHIFARRVLLIPNSFIPRPFQIWFFAEFCLHRFPESLFLLCTIWDRLQLNHWEFDSTHHHFESPFEFVFPPKQTAKDWYLYLNFASEPNNSDPSWWSRRHWPCLATCLTDRTTIGLTVCTISTHPIWLLAYLYWSASNSLEGNLLSACFLTNFQAHGNRYSYVCYERG